MADAGEHRRALLDLAVDALAHLVEGDRCLAHFTSAARREVGNRAALAELVDCARQSEDGRIWLRRKMMAMVRSTTLIPTIQARKAKELEA